MTTWYALEIRRKPRAPFAEHVETIVAGNISRGLGLLSYVPVDIHRVQMRHRCLVIRRPLIEGCIFIGSANGIPWRDVLETRHVMDVIRIDGEAPYPISDAEIGLLRIETQKRNKSTTDRRSHRIGDSYKVKTGSFASIEGVLSLMKGKNVELEAKMLGSNRTIRTTVDNLERVA